MNYYYDSKRSWQMAPSRLPPRVEEKESAQYAGLKAIRPITSFFIRKATQMLKLVQRVHRRKTPFISLLAMLVKLKTKFKVAISEMILRTKSMNLIAVMINFW